MVSLDKDLQDSILRAVNILVRQGISQMNYTSSNIGIVRSVQGFECVVEIQGSELSCVLMEHLQDWIQNDDIVIVQDLYNDNSKKAVIGKIGTSRPTSFTIFDTEKGKSVSGVEQLFDEEKKQELDTILEV